MKERRGEPATVPDVPLGRQLSVYAAGAFSNSMANVVGIVIALWALRLEPSPMMLGLIFASRHFLPLLFSIHGGALMDRLGTRRVMIYMAVAGVVLPLVYPLAPALLALVLLQMITGFANAMVWVGAQASVTQLLHGSAVYAGRFSFALRVGLFAGPPAAGLAWDLLGAWGGFAFVSIWASGVLVAALYMGVADGHEQRQSEPITLKGLLPRVSDYVDAFRLLAIPGMGIIVTISSIRIANVSIQDTFFVVLLGAQDFSATQIGLLLSIASVVGAAFTLQTASLMRFVSPYWLMVLCVIGSILTIAITPLAGSFIVLALAAGLRGALMGLSQPLVITLLSESVGKEAVGKGFGLRMTANRLAAAAMPLVMGAVVTVVGLEASFLIMGGLLIAMTLCVAYALRRMQGL